MQIKMAGIVQLMTGLTLDQFRSIGFDLRMTAKAHALSRPRV